MLQLNFVVKCIKLVSSYLSGVTTDSFDSLRTIQFKLLEQNLFVCFFSQIKGNISSKKENYKFQEIEKGDENSSNTMQNRITAATTTNCTYILFLWSNYRK